MKFAMRFIPIAVVSAAVFLVASDGGSSALTVHEWGTFTSVAGEDGSAMDWDTLGCKDDLPRFVHARGYRGFKWRLQGTVRMETPVMYFYSPREMDVRVKVRFPHGVITEWYPDAETAIYQRMVKLAPSMNGIDTSLRDLMGAIEWQSVKVQPNTSPALPAESEPSRYYAARETDSAPVMVGNQQEKFLFYRGVGRVQVSLSARISDDGKILVANRGTDPVPSVILFENRGGRLGYRNLGTVTAAALLDPPTLDGALAALKYDLETALVAQGLYPKEAQAMIETWRDSWFEEGSRLIYIVPSSAIDAILPLQIEPAPSHTARAFVGRIELITPETERAVKDAMAKGDWNTIDRYQRFLDPILKRISPQSSEKFAGANRCQ